MDCKNTTALSLPPARSQEDRELRNANVAFLPMPWLSPSMQTMHNMSVGEILDEALAVMNGAYDLLDCQEISSEADEVLQQHHPNGLDEEDGEENNDSFGSTPASTTKSGGGQSFDG